MRLRRFRGTIVVSMLVSAAFIADGLAGGEPPGANAVESDGDGLTRGTEDSGAARGTDRGSGLPNSLGLTSGAGVDGPRGAQGTETGGSRMGGGSRLGGNSVRGLDTGGGGGSGGSGLLDPAKPSIF